MKIEIQSRALVTLEEALTDLSITCFKPAEDAFGKRRQSVLLTFTSSGIGGAQVQYHIDHQYHFAKLYFHPEQIQLYLFDYIWVM